MTARADILDQPEPLGRSFAIALALHVGVAAAVFGLNFAGHRKVEQFGDPSGGGFGSIAVTPTATIPLPSRGGPVNPVANETDSRVPEPPAKAKPSVAEREPDPDAVAIKGKKQKKTRAESASSPNKWRAQQKDRPNQLYTSGGQALSSPMIGMTGGGGVGVGTSSPFGTRFGYYADLLRRRIAEKWNTGDVDPRMRNAPSVTVQFVIRRDGSVPANSVRVVQRSGVPALDYSAQRAVYDAVPMPPLPQGFERNEAVVEFVFELRR
jgi:protein TonB